MISAWLILPALAAGLLWGWIARGWWHRFDTMPPVDPNDVGPAPVDYAAWHAAREAEREHAHTHQVDW